MSDSKHRTLAELTTYLLERAEHSGYLAASDILDAIPDSEDATGLWEGLMLSLQRAGVDVYADDDTDDGFLEETVDMAVLVSDDTVGLYLREMARVPLLSLVDEVQLAQRITAGEKAKATLRAGTMPPGSEHTRLAATIEDANQARDHLIRANTRLVVSIAKRYLGRGVLFLDLIQEGNLGLIKAVEKFDHQRGFRFSTYATWWIRQTISRAVSDQSRTIRVPVHMNDRIRKLYKLTQEFEQAYGRKPTAAELAPDLALDVRKVEWLQQVSWHPVSLQDPISEDDESELETFIEDDLMLSPVQSATESLLRDKVNELLSSLSPREARVLRLRFGLQNSASYTLEEVGQKFGLTRERIRQIEGKALRRLRHPFRSQQLREYLS